MPISPKYARGERGSALLVVLVFAAVIAIMLYRELPIAAFEAQRQKEELLVSRGNEYKRGVKLFVRKMGRFPSTIDELENTNRMRFLRHRYVDPFTGKDNWRMIHAGPGGIILDSKVATPNTNTNASTLGQGATFAGFNNSFSGDAAAAAAQAAENTPSAGLRQRPPATKNAASASTDPLAAVAGTADAPPDPDNPNPQLPNGQSAANAAVANSVNTLADQLNNTNPKTPETAPVQSQQNQGLGNTSAFGGSTSAFGNSASGQPQNGQNGVVGNQGATVGNGQTAGGGIAGVASIAEGKGIKLVNDQKKYKLWEFYYDLRKEQNAAGGALGQGGLGQGQNTGANGQGTSTFGNSSFGNSSSFGNNNNSTFGQSGSSNSGSTFGGSSGTTTQQPPPAPVTQPSSNP